MSRIRTIKPQAFKSLTLARVSRDARWLFAGIWTECDDEGRMLLHPRLLRTAVFPMDDDVTDELVTSWLGDLEHIGAICRYSVEGRDFLHVPGWEHQKINRPTPGKLPECPKHRGAPEQGSLPILTPVAGHANPRRCPKHQLGAAVPCGACKEARETFDAAKRTFTGPVTKCGEHPQHAALRCPECAAIPTTEGPPSDWRNRTGS